MKSGKSHLTIHNDLNEIDLEQNGGFNSKCIVTDINWFFCKNKNSSVENYEVDFKESSLRQIVWFQLEQG